MEQKKFYITTAIPYVNAPPHIGHALEFIQADVLARYHRLKGEDVFFLTGTDEHGVKIVQAAENAGKTPQEWADKNAAEFKKLIEALSISNDDFIRTSDQKGHWPGAQKLWRELEKSGDIYKKKYRGFYCVGHEAFITEKDLTNGKCRDHKKEPEVIEEENYFFRLSKYSREIESRISAQGGSASGGKNNELRIVPETRKNEILSLLKEGLEDVSFSRPRKDLSWGVPVPGDETHTMYVWCDALSNYITALGYGSDQNVDISKFQRWWPADVHVIGKDILRFHVAIWPGMLLSAGLPLPKTIFVHGFITVGGEKMSKTVGNVIDPFEVVKKYGTDALRYYLLREIPPTGDGDFTYEKFEERYNGDLAKGLGNFVSRVLTLAEKSDVKIESKLFTEIIKDVESNADKFIKDFKFNDALSAIWQLVSAGDKYIDDKKPWTLDANSQEYKNIISALLSLVFEIGRLVEPFLPETSEKISKAVEDKKSVILFPRLS
ncbi:MAG: Methionine-tRNA ligase [Candidatus Azambacteria bacterium GW2011_GWA2_42_9]|uniref:Methionine--tRNA ligase n=1 Tax=Candidatus Azambacteria bacterium GW2011_GWA2_42_9 TaxID=1618613 RepID=A0A0G1DXL4_9BACT|nr:MAG: Methionine-tRNA ligase [Candidatus Azambacteria bacterium GW2011_GWA2_42_9]